jgi:hypothetical protein
VSGKRGIRAFIVILDGKLPIAEGHIGNPNIHLTADSPQRTQPVPGFHPREGSSARIAQVASGLRPMHFDLSRLASPSAQQN